MSTELATQHQGGMDLIRTALQGDGTPSEKAALVRELVALQQSMERFTWEREERQYRIDFDAALSRCQSKVELLKPNQGRKSRKTAQSDDIFWLDYVGLDASIRPIYLAEGFSISFSEVEEGKDGYVGMKATLSRSGISRDFFKRLTLAAAFEGMPKADAEASAASRVKRYLMLQIFNVAIGIDADEKKPFSEDQLQSWVGKLAGATDTTELNRISLEAIKDVRGDTSAVQAIGQAKNKRIKEIREANNA